MAGSEHDGNDVAHVRNGVRVPAFFQTSTGRFVKGCACKHQHAHTHPSAVFACYLCQRRAAQYMAPSIGRRVVDIDKMPEHSFLFSDQVLLIV